MDTRGYTWISAQKRKYQALSYDRSVETCHPSVLYWDRITKHDAFGVLVHLLPLLPLLPDHSAHEEAAKYEHLSSLHFALSVFLNYYYYYSRIRKSGTHEHENA